MAPKLSLVTCSPAMLGTFTVRLYLAVDRSVHPCFSQPPPGTWIVVGSTAGR